MKFITCLFCMFMCACGSDGVPEKPLSFVGVRAELNTN